MVWLGEGWAPPSDIAQESPHGMSAKKKTIPDQSSPGSPRTAPPAVHQGRVGEKWITGVPKKDHPCQKQHHHWHLECKNTERCGKTRRTPT